MRAGPGPHFLPLAAKNWGMHIEIYTHPLQSGFVPVVVYIADIQIYSYTVLPPHGEHAQTLVVILWLYLWSLYFYTNYHMSLWTGSKLALPSVDLFHLS